MRRLRSMTLHLALPLALLAVAAMLAGCGRPAIVDRRPVAPVEARPASLLAAVAAAETATPLPWYYDRNDYGPTVVRAYPLGGAEYVDTRTYDRQSTAHGDVHDHYHQITRRHRFYGEILPLTR